MRKYLKIIAIAAMVAMATPAIGQAAGNAGVKKTCMDMANMIANMMAQTGGNHSKEILAAFGEGMEKASGTVTTTDTELLWLTSINGQQVTVQVNVYTALRKVYVQTKGPGVYESASAKY